MCIYFIHICHCIGFMMESNDSYTKFLSVPSPTIEWRQNERNCAWNHRRLYCLLRSLFRRRSKKISKLRVTGFVRRIHQWPVNSPPNGPVTRKMFPFDDVMIIWHILSLQSAPADGLVWKLTAVKVSVISDWMENIMAMFQDIDVFIHGFSSQRQSWDRLIFIMQIPCTKRQYIYIEMETIQLHHGSRDRPVWLIRDIMDLQWTHTLGYIVRL